MLRLIEGSPSSYRRSRCLVAYWHADDLTVVNYVTGGTASVSPSILDLLDRFSEPRTLDHLSGPAVQAAQELAECDALVEVGSALDQRESRVADIWMWGEEARHYHFASRLMEFETDLRRVDEALIERARESPPPSPYKSQTCSARPLTGIPFKPSDEFWRTLLARRTVRRFAPNEITFHDFSTVLRWTWGATHHIKNGELGPHLLKTSPSGGARHVVEVYPVVLRVEGVAPGIYHYATQRDGLELIQEGRFDDALVEMCAGQSWVKDAAVTFFMTAVLPRTMWKYHQSHAYRVVHLDAGHVGQTFHLVCTRLGLAPFTTAAFDADLVENTLGVDGVEEIAIYAACTGQAAALP